MAKIIDVEVLDNFKLRQDAVNDAWFLKRSNIEKEGNDVKITVRESSNPEGIVSYNVLTPDSTVRAEQISGVLDISNIPAAARERVKQVADQSERFSLTNDPDSGVQRGDVVHQLNPNRMFFVVNENSLNNENGYEEFVAGNVDTASSVPWSGVESRPDVVTNVLPGSSNGTLKVTKSTASGTTTSVDVAVKGLNTAAYHPENYFVDTTTFNNHNHNSSYAPLNHTHTYDSSMSDSSTNAVQNKIVKTYVDNKVTNIAYDSSMSDSSTNAVQNKVIKAYVDNKAASSGITCDTAMSSTSTNPVQNKVVKAYIDNLGDQYFNFTIDPTVTSSSANPVASSGIWSYVEAKAASSVDSSMSSTSTNPVQNKVIKSYVDGKGFTARQLSNSTISFTAMTSLGTVLATSSGSAEIFQLSSNMYIVKIPDASLTSSSDDIFSVSVTLGSTILSLCNNNAANIIPLSGVAMFMPSYVYNYNTSSYQLDTSGGTTDRTYVSTVSVTSNMDINIVYPTYASNRRTVYTPVLCLLMMKL